MKTVTIKQAGKRCEVWNGSKLFFSGGRVIAKREALALAKNTGARLVNIKKGGSVVTCAVAP